VKKILKHSANEFSVEILKDCNPVNQTTFGEKIPMDPNPPKILHNSFESNKPARGVLLSRKA
jgi:hypothetical protein